MWNTYRYIATHQADSGCTGRERVQNGHNNLERFGDPVIIPLRLTDRSRLILKHGDDELDRFAVLEFLGEWVTD